MEPEEIVSDPPIPPEDAAQACYLFNDIQKMSGTNVYQPELVTKICKLIAVRIGELKRGAAIQEAKLLEQQLTEARNQWNVWRDTACKLEDQLRDRSRAFEKSINVVKKLLSGEI